MKWVNLLIAFFMGLLVVIFMLGVKLLLSALDLVDVLSGCSFILLGSTVLFYIGVVAFGDFFSDKTTSVADDKMEGK